MILSLLPCLLVPCPWGVISLVVVYGCDFCFVGRTSSGGVTTSFWGEGDHSLCVWEWSCVYNRGLWPVITGTREL